MTFLLIIVIQYDKEFIVFFLGEPEEAAEAEDFFSSLDSNASPPNQAENAHSSSHKVPAASTSLTG